jgi:sulfate permease, SulP family
MSVKRAISQFLPNELREQVKRTTKPLRAVLLNLEACSETDVTSLEMLEHLRSELSESGIDLWFARVADPVRDLSRRSGFLESLGEKRIFPGIELAVDAFLESKPLTVHVLSA